MEINGILASIRNGGLQNPIREAVNAKVSGLVIPSVLELTGMSEAQSLISGVPNPSVPEVQAMHASMIAALGSINSLLGHTNGLSGVDLGANGTLMTIAKTAVAARRINGESSCSNVLQSFGSLHKAGELITDTLNIIENITQSLLDIPRRAVAIVNDVSNYVTKITNQISSDVAALATAQADVVQSALSRHLVEMFEDECLGGIAKGIMRETLAYQVELARDAAREQYKKARFNLP